MCGITFKFHYSNTKCRNSNLEFVNPVDLRELHVVVKQSLRNDVQDTQPLCTTTNNWVRSKLDIIDINLAERGWFTVTVEKTRHLAPGSVI